MRRLLPLIVGLLLAVTSTGCSLPGSIAGDSPAAAVDYSKPENMAGAIALLRTALGGDDQVFRLTMGTDEAVVHTLTQAHRVVNGAVEPESATLAPILDQGVPLASLDPAAAMARLSEAAAERGCTDPTRIALTVYATQQVIADLTCTLDGQRVQLVEGPDGDLLDEIDLTTTAGITKAVSDVLAVTPPNARFTQFAFQYDTSSGIPSLLAITGRVSTLRTSQITPEVPALFQANTGVDSLAQDFDITDITPETFAAVYEGAKAKCGDVSLLHLVLATNGEPKFLSGTFSCPYEADRTGQPL